MSVADERKGQIIDAALACFLRNGYQKTTMEEIARLARISRPALYQYFDDKAAIFRGVVGRLQDEAMEGARRSLAGSDSLAERLGGAFEAKYSSTVHLVGSSPHAAELFDSNDRIAGDLAAAAHTTLQRLLRSTLRTAEQRGEIDLGRRRLTVAGAARLIDHAVQGVVNHALAEPSTWPGELYRLIAIIGAGLAAGPRNEH
jgi:AcrR family transcriptional regulator